MPWPSDRKHQGLRLLLNQRSYITTQALLQLYSLWLNWLVNRQIACTQNDLSYLPPASVPILSQPQQQQHPQKSIEYLREFAQSSGTVWKSRWTSWAHFPVPNSPRGICGRKITLMKKKTCKKWKHVESGDTYRKCVAKWKAWCIDKNNVRFGSHYISLCVREYEMLCVCVCLCIYVGLCVCSCVWV